MDNTFSSNDVQNIPFKAETRQLLNILIHSLYSDRDVFLRELISNASDALTKINYEMLTNHDVVSPDAELAIRITADPEHNTISIIDTGIGMDKNEIADNLGTIAHSGAISFIEAVKDKNLDFSQLIGQFGVGFYSVFMVADRVKVISRSHKPDAEAVTWTSAGEDSFSLETGSKSDRGTEIVIELKDDASEYCQEFRLRQIINKHSDYIPFPIYLSDEKEQVNKQTALWRDQPHQVSEEQYLDFYKQFSLDYENPITHLHLSIDAPIQLYALLYIPSSSERNVLSPRTQDGIKLFARKILIQDYCQDLLPGFFRFIQGVVDSEDLPLNISRESYQSSRSIAQLKKIISSKLIDSLKKLTEEDQTKYDNFWKEYGRFIKEGIATDQEYFNELIPLLRFHTISSTEKWMSLDEYCQNFISDQKSIYYIVGDDERSIIFSPHLEAFKKKGFDVLLLTDPIDSFMLMRLDKYHDYQVVNIANETLEFDDESTIKESSTEEQSDLTKTIIDLFKSHLGDKIEEVKITNQLFESPARLVDTEGTLSPEMQHVYKLLNKDFEVPKKNLEINLKHPIIKRLSELPSDDSVVSMIIEQIYENSLLIEGIHPDPASMIHRIQNIMEESLKPRS